MLRQTIETFRSYINVFFIFFAILLNTNVHATGWEEISPGIEYRDLGLNILTPWSHVHVFRVDLKKNKLDLSFAHNLGHQHASVDELALHSHALIAVNGGFFDSTYRPLGLRVGHHHQYTPIKPISWWGVFSIKDDKPSLSKFSSVSPNSLDFAVQSGPRLIIQGKIPSLKPGLAERTALGITEKNEVIILVTDHMPLSTRALATLMKSFPLSCSDALNLDGGSSTQLYAHMGGFQLNVPGFAQVTDAVIVQPKKR